MTFRSLYRHGFARVAACTTRCAIADPATNAARLLDVARDCHDQGAALAVFSELGLSGYAIDDLRLQDAVLDAVERAIAHIVEASKALRPLLLFGAPVRHRGRVYNVAVAVHRGRLLGVVPKLFMPNYREFYEPRQLASGVGSEGSEIELLGGRVPFGPDLLFAAEDVRGFVVHA